MNMEIRDLEHKVINLFNEYQLEPEVKRLIAQNVLNELTKVADARIMEEIQEVKENGLHKNSMGE